VSAFVVLISIGAGVLHATWNALAKQVDDRFALFSVIGVVFVLSGAAALSITGLPNRSASTLALVSAAIHVAYQAALINAYRLGAFNQTYPIARGTSPLLVAAGAYFLVDERLDHVHLAGVAILALGLMSLAVSSGTVSRVELPAITAAVLAGLTIASYSLVDGLGVRHSHDAYSYAALLFLLEGVAFPAIFLARSPTSARRSGPILKRGVLAGLLSLLAYGAILWAQARAPLAEVAALRETSVISAAVIGALFLREPFGVRRLAAATLVAAGVFMISI
jgi:drug/metabolite transporter (DMT)-like permease